MSSSTSTAKTRPDSPDRLGEPEREIAAARAEIGDAVARPDSEQRDHGVGLLPFVAVEALVREALPGRASRAVQRERERRGERETAGRSHAGSASRAARAECAIARDPALCPGMARRSLAAALALDRRRIAPALAHAQRTRGDQVPLGDLIEIVVMDDEILAVDAESGGSSVVRRQLGESVLWTGTRGRVGVVITDRARARGSRRARAAGRRLPYERGEAPRARRAARRSRRA